VAHGESPACNAQAETKSSKSFLVLFFKKELLSSFRKGASWLSQVSHTILAGWVETDLTEAAFANERFAGNVLPRMPMRRWGQREDFGGIAVYLMSDASSWHTGDSFVIDGGYRIF
jgi:hypothetical protein